MPTKHRITPHPHTHPIHKRRPVATIGVGIAICLALIALLITRTARAPKDIPSGATAATKHDSTTRSTDWPTYTDNRFPLSFKYPTDWVVTGQTAGTDYYITVKPKENALEKITIFISGQGYLGFEGLKEEKLTLDGKEGVKIDNGLAGLRYKDQYYTFDAGLYSATEVVFQELLKSVKLN